MLTNRFSQLLYGMLHPHPSDRFSILQVQQEFSRLSASDFDDDEEVSDEDSDDEGGYWVVKPTDGSLMK